jgi:hypothetical protein
MQIVHVTPQAIGWAVAGCGETQFFSSGAWAERAGRRLARALADAGETVDLLIADRSGRLAGRIRLGRAADAEAEAERALEPA